MSESGKLDDLAETFVRASRALIAIALHSVVTSPVEVTLVQFRVLVLIAGDDGSRNGSRSISELAEQLGVNQSNASRHCDRLETLGLINRRRSLEDARIVCVELTRAGQNVVAAVMRQRHADIKAVLSQLGPSEAASASDALHLFNEAALHPEEGPWRHSVW